MLLEAALLICLARAALLLVPFPMLARRLGRFTPPADPPAPPALARDEAVRVAEIGRAIATAARRLPFRAVCLPQAIAARLMLSRRGISTVLHFGAIRNRPAGSAPAHAWLSAGDLEVTGYPVAHDCIEVGRFA